MRGIIVPGHGEVVPPLAQQLQRPYFLLLSSRSSSRTTTAAAAVEEVSREVRDSAEVVVVASAAAVEVRCEAEPEVAVGDVLGPALERQQVPGADPAPPARDGVEAVGADAHIRERHADGRADDGGML
jgi:hypothetical protein